MYLIALGWLDKRKACRTFHMTKEEKKAGWLVAQIQQSLSHFQHEHKKRPLSGLQIDFIFDCVY